MSKKIIILGKIETKFKAPFEDTSWEIWSMNKHKDADQLPRVDKWFDLHLKPENLAADITRRNFPFQACNNLVGGMYFNNSVSYLIAYAILMGATDIALYGMRFHSDHERRKGELYNVRQWIFFAKGRGVNITIPEDEQYILPDLTPEANQEFDA